MTDDGTAAWGRRLGDTSVQRDAIRGRECRGGFGYHIGERIQGARSSVQHPC
jgi:hypothetical protein